MKTLATSIAALGVLIAASTSTQAAPKFLPGVQFKAAMDQSYGCVSDATTQADMNACKTGNKFAGHKEYGVAVEGFMACAQKVFDEESRNPSAGFSEKIGKNNECLLATQGYNFGSGMKLQ